MGNLHNLTTSLPEGDYTGTRDSLGAMDNSNICLDKGIFCPDMRVKAKETKKKVKEKERSRAASEKEIDHR